MGFDTSEAIRRWTGDEHLTDQQVMGYSGNLSGIFDRRCGVSRDPEVQRDNFQRAMAGFDIVRRISGVPILHVALPQTFDQFLGSRGCPDSTQREIFHRQLLTNYLEVYREATSRESVMVMRAIIDGIRMRRFTAEEEEALSGIRTMMKWGDPFFELIGMRLLKLIRWEDSRPHMPRDFVESVGSIASYDGELYKVFKFDDVRTAIWTVVDVLDEDEEEDDGSSGSVPPTESGAPPAPAAASSGRGGGDVLWGLPELGVTIAEGLAYYTDVASEWLSGLESHTSTVTGIFEPDETSGTYDGDYSLHYARGHQTIQNARLGTVAAAQTFGRTTVPRTFIGARASQPYIRI